MNSKISHRIELNESFTKSKFFQTLTAVKPVFKRLILILDDLTFKKLLIYGDFNLVKGNVCVLNKNVIFKRFRHNIETICQKKILATNLGLALEKTIAPDVLLHLSRMKRRDRSGLKSMFFYRIVELLKRLIVPDTFQS